MATNDDRRLNEANDCIRKAKEFLKTSLFSLKFKPNFDSAAYEYERAAVCFRNANKLNLCADAYLEAAKCHSSNRNMFHDAKAKEAAALAFKDLKNYEKAIALYMECCESYFNSGSVDTSASLIEKVAKSFESIDPANAMKLYQKGLEFVQHEGSKYSANFLQRLILLNMKKEQFDEAIDLSKQLIEKYIEMGDVNRIGQIVLGIAVMYLRKGDSIASLQTLALLPDIAFFGQEMAAVKQLVQIYEESNNEELQKCLKGGIWRALDNEYIRCATKLEVANDGKRREQSEDEEEDLR